MPETVRHQALTPNFSFSVTGWAFPLPRSQMKGFWLSLTPSLPLLSVNPLSHQALCVLLSQCFPDSSLLSTPVAFVQCQLWFPPICDFLAHFLPFLFSFQTVLPGHQPLERPLSLVLSRSLRGGSMIWTSQTLISCPPSLKRIPCKKVWNDDYQAHSKKDLTPQTESNVENIISQLLSKHIFHPLLVGQQHLDLDNQWNLRSRRSRSSGSIDKWRAQMTQVKKKESEILANFSSVLNGRARRQVFFFFFKPRT